MLESQQLTIGQLPLKPRGHVIGIYQERTDNLQMCKKPRLETV